MPTRSMWACEMSKASTVTLRAMERSTSSGSGRGGSMRAEDDTHGKQVMDAAVGARAEKFLVVTLHLGIVHPEVEEDLYSCHVRRRRRDGPCCRLCTRHHRRRSLPPCRHRGGTAWSLDNDRSWSGTIVSYPFNGVIERLHHLADAANAGKGALTLFPGNTSSIRRMKRIPPRAMIASKSSNFLRMECSRS